MLKFYATFLTVMLLSQNAISENLIEKAIKTVDADILFMRHALAPGIGDPENFLLSDCDTQRNLNDEGKKHAIKIGVALAKAKIKIDKILSSQWCRCYDTAILMDLGDVEIFSGLNSFYQRHAEKEATLLKLRAYLKEKPSESLILMVTHQVVISAITGVNVTSGGFVAYNSKTGKLKPFSLASTNM